MTVADARSNGFPLVDAPIEIMRTRLEFTRDEKTVTNDDGARPLNPDMGGRTNDYHLPQ